MDWPSWIEKVFNRIAEEWQESEEAQRHGVLLTAERMFPEIADVHVPAALISAFIDLEYLGLVSDPDISNPPQVHLTTEGQRAAEIGFSQAILPQVQAACTDLPDRERRLLENLVRRVASRRQPEGYARPFTCRETMVYRETFGGEESGDPEDLTWNLWERSLAVRTAVDDPRIPDRAADFDVWPLYAGFKCIELGAERARRSKASQGGNDRAAEPAFLPEAEQGMPFGEAGRERRSVQEERTVTLLDEFRSRASVLRGGEAGRLRARYIERFVDTSTETYRQNIEGKGWQGDDVHYTSYLWDTLKHAAVITQRELLADLSHRGPVYVFWDLHSDRKILIPNYWKFPKDAVLRVPSSDLIDVLVHDSEVEQPEDLILPEDLYIFDESMSSSLITTHEYVRERFCLRAT